MEGCERFSGQIGAFVAFAFFLLLCWVGVGCKIEMNLSRRETKLIEPLPIKDDDYRKTSKRPHGLSRFEFNTGCDYASKAIIKQETSHDPNAVRTNNYYFPSFNDYNSSLSLLNR